MTGLFVSFVAELRSHINVARTPNVSKINYLMDKHQNYKDLISDGQYDEAMTVLNCMIGEDPTDDRAFFDRGKLKWRLGDRAGAMGDYSKATELNPDSPAAMALEQARDIAGFFNPDLYNP